MKFALKIAVRFLKSSKSQTILIALGIAVGVSVQIFIGSLIQGLQKSLINKTIGNSPQVTITSNKDNRYISNYSNLINIAKSSDNRITNIAVASDDPALIKNSSKAYSILVRGMNLDDSNKIYDVIGKIYSGRKPINDNEAILGKELAKNLGVKVGDKVELITNSSKIADLTISGLYDLNVATINNSWVITTLNTSQNIFEHRGEVTGIEMQVNSIFKADEIAAALSNKISSSFKVDNWKAQNAQLLSGLNGQSVSSIMIQVFVLIAVVLGIASVLAITVIQKSRQIGILKAMGLKDKTSSLIFLFEGLLLGIIGTILGVALGLSLSFIFTKFALNPDGTPVVELNIDYGFIALSSLIALASATIASLIPAKHSSKLNPIEVIKNG